MLSQTMFALDPMLRVTVAWDVIMLQYTVLLTAEAIKLIAVIVS
jgi:hypothetical protein